MTPESLHILIVEDNLAEVRLLQENLQCAEEAKFTIVHAASMSEALSALSANRFHAILLDLSLPDSFGLATLDAALAACGRTPVVVLTGHADQELAREVLRHGAQDYLVKSDSDGRSTVRAILYAVARKKVQEDQEQLRLQAEVLKASENEQRRLGRDLHDSIQSSLVGLGMMIAALKQRVAKLDAQLADEFDPISTVARETLAHTRGLSKSLCPLDLNEGGLHRALLQLAETTSGVFRVPCQVDRADAVKLADEAMATHVYYIAREAVTNAVKHARSKKIAISLHAKPNGLLLTVHDDGKGLPEEARSNRGLGLRTMEYRAKLVGGALSVTSGPNQGTTVRLTIPESVAP